MSESGLQLRTEVSDTGQLTLRLQEVQFPAPGEDEVLVKLRRHLLIRPIWVCYLDRQI